MTTLFRDSVSAGVDVMPKSEPTMSPWQVLIWFLLLLWLMLMFLPYDAAQYGLLLLAVVMLLALFSQ